MSSAFSDLFFGERSLTKVAALYARADDAQAARARLVGSQGWPAARVVLLEPRDAKAARRELTARKLEPESRGIFATVLRAHLILGVAGFAAGVSLWGWMWRSGLPLVAASPALAFVAVVFLGTVFGLMLGGLVALRPDHANLIVRVRSALEGGQWAVVAHPLDAAQAAQAEAALKAGSRSVERTV